jgi:hypothetical protein
MPLVVMKSPDWTAGVRPPCRWVFPIAPKRSKVRPTARMGHIGHHIRHHIRHVVPTCGASSEITTVFQCVGARPPSPLTSRHIARSAYPASLAWVHCVLLGSLLTTLAVQPSRCRRFIGTPYADIKHYTRDVYESGARRSKKFAANRDNEHGITFNESLHANLSTLPIGFRFCDFVV